MCISTRYIHNVGSTASHSTVEDVCMYVCMYVFVDINCTYDRSIRALLDAMVQYNYFIRGRILDECGLL